MVKYKPVEFDIFPPKIISDNQVNSLILFLKFLNELLMKHEDLFVVILLVDMRL
jgi:hypothetical protein